MAYHEVNDEGHRKFLNDQEYNDWKFKDCLSKILTVPILIWLFYSADKCTSSDNKSEEKQKTEQVSTPKNGVSKSTKSTNHKKEHNKKTSQKNEQYETTVQTDDSRSDEVVREVEKAVQPVEDLDGRSVGAEEERHDVHDSPSEVSHYEDACAELRAQ